MRMGSRRLRRGDGPRAEPGSLPPNGRALALGRGPSASFDQQLESTSSRETASGMGRGEWKRAAALSDPSAWVRGVFSTLGFRELGCRRAGAASVLASVLASAGGERGWPR